MEAGGEAVVFLFAEFGEGEGTLGEGGGVGAFGHEEDVLFGDGDLGGEGFDFGEVGGGGEDEFPLVVFDGAVAVSGEGFQDWEVDAVFFVGLGEAAGLAIVRGGVGEFGGDGGEVDAVFWEVVEPEGAGGFEGDVEVVGFQGGDEVGEFFEEHGFAAGEDDVGAVIGEGFLEDGVDGHVGAIGGPGGVGGVAPGAAEVAAGGADEDGGGAGKFSFALEGVEDFADAHEGIVEGGMVNDE